MTTTITSYGSQVQTSGDIFIRDATFSEKLMAKESTGVDVKVDEGAHVLDGTETQEYTRITHTYESGDVSGSTVLRCLDSSELKSTLKTYPLETNIVSDGITATIHNGLSFDSNDSSIFFGASKVFRIKYTSDTPERLLFQYLDTDTDTYVTKFSCART